MWLHIPTSKKESKLSEPEEEHGCREEEGVPSASWLQEGDNR